jgi:hypothetical protein
MITGVGEVEHGNELRAGLGQDRPAPTHRQRCHLLFAFRREMLSETTSPHATMEAVRQSQSPFRPAAGVFSCSRITEASRSSMGRPTRTRGTLTRRIASCASGRTAVSVFGRLLPVVVPPPEGAAMSVLAAPVVLPIPTAAAVPCSMRNLFWTWVTPGIRSAQTSARRFASRLSIAPTGSPRSSRRSPRLPMHPAADRW